MDKRVIFAVAGSGKTTYIVNSIDLEKRTIIITYTVENIQNIKNSIIMRFGYFPKSIELLSYFSFLYSFCYRPILSQKFKDNGITFSSNPNKYERQSSPKYFLDKTKRLYSNRIAKLITNENELTTCKKRLARYFDAVLIDEVQDFASHDFKLIIALMETNCSILCVGDFYQHTFDTSQDGSAGKNLHQDFNKYKLHFTKKGVIDNSSLLSHSHRCSPTICKFIRDNLNIEIYSHRIDSTEIIIIDSQQEANSIFKNNEIIKLFYQDSSKYNCFSKNWAKSKGEDMYIDVCVVLNPTTEKLFKKNKLHELKPRTKNKLYVACSRAKGKLYFVSQNFYKEKKL